MSQAGGPKDELQGLDEDPKRGERIQRHLNSLANRPKWISAVLFQWQTFSYNYKWSDYVRLLDGWVPKCAVLVPFFGYAILFNDTVSSMFSFAHLAGADSGWRLFSNLDRLRFIYFGLIMLGAANLIYWWRRPWVTKTATNQFDYVERGLNNFTLGDFIQIHHSIRREGHVTLDGKYYDSEWDGFREAASNKGEGTDAVERTGNWDDAKRRYGSLLRSMLRENFSSGIRLRRLSLSVCLLLALVGYALLIVPSAELFVRVTAATLGL